MTGEFLSQARLKERGWTPALVRKHLGEPDKTVVNPVFRSQAPAKLYAVTRIETVEDSQAFQLDQLRAKKRSEAARKAADVKRAEALAWAKTVRMEFAVAPFMVVRKAAIAAYNSHGFERSLQRGDYDWMPASSKSSREFLDRISVNHLRHQHSSYEEWLSALYGVTGQADAVQVLRARVYAEIAKQYPGLAEECLWQARERGVTL